MIRFVGAGFALRAVLRKFFLHYHPRPMTRSPKPTTLAEPRPLRLYLDTSVFGGVYDNEFKEASNMLFDKIKAGKFVCIYSRATATICNADFLISWNFKHIVNVFRIKNYNSVNMQNGYKSLDIRSPKEVIYD